MSIGENETLEAEWLEFRKQVLANVPDNADVLWAMRGCFMAGATATVRQVRDSGRGGPLSMLKKVVALCREMDAWAEAEKKDIDRTGSRN